MNKTRGKLAPDLSTAKGHPMRINEATRGCTHDSEEETPEDLGASESWRIIRTFGVQPRCLGDESEGLKARIPPVTSVGVRKARAPADI